MKNETVRDSAQTRAFDPRPPSSGLPLFTCARCARALNRTRFHLPPTFISPASFRRSVKFFTYSCDSRNLHGTAVFRQGRSACLLPILALPRNQEFYSATCTAKSAIQRQSTFPPQPIDFIVFTRTRRKLHPTSFHLEKPAIPHFPPNPTSPRSRLAGTLTPNRNLHQTRVVPCLYREPEYFFTATSITHRTRSQSTFPTQVLESTVFHVFHAFPSNFTHRSGQFPRVCPRSDSLCPLCSLLGALCVTLSPRRLAPLITYHLPLTTYDRCTSELRWFGSVT